MSATTARVKGARKNKTLGSSGRWYGQEGEDVKGAWGQQVFERFELGGAGWMRQGAALACTETACGGAVGAGRACAV